MILLFHQLELLVMLGAERTMQTTGKQAQVIHGIAYTQNGSSADQDDL